MKLPRRLAAAVLTALTLALCLAGPAQAATGHHSAAWSRVLRYCHRTHACHLVPAGLRRDLGIGHLPARIRYEDDAAGQLATVIWVREPGGRVRAFTS